MSDTPPDVRRRAPLLGEHTDVVLREAGFSDSEIAAMQESGAAGVRS
jgi:crotonobetainyl-CoA:carnitine CoA-transferase CaiB-like acyl-CoA transferase